MIDRFWFTVCSKTVVKRQVIDMGLNVLFGIRSHFTRFRPTDKFRRGCVSHGRIMIICPRLFPSLTWYTGSMRNLVLRQPILH